jgi:hypothetical protein
MATPKNVPSLHFNGFAIAIDKGNVVRISRERLATADEKKRANDARVMLETLSIRFYGDGRAPEIIHCGLGDVV